MKNVPLRFVTILTSCPCRSGVGLAFARKLLMKFRDEDECGNRRQLVANATAWFEGPGGELLACTLRNVGDDGAQLCMIPDIDYPDNFTIRLTEDGKVKRLCRLISHSKNCMDVIFVETDGTPVKEFSPRFPVRNL